MQALIGRLVKCTRTKPKKNEPNCFILEICYGTIVKVDSTRSEPFLIKFVHDDGFMEQVWFSGFNIEVIR